MKYSGEHLTPPVVYEAAPQENELCIARMAIWRGEQLLFIQRHDQAGNYSGYLEFPGGKIDDCNDAFAQVMQEVKEETNLNLLPLHAPPMEHRYKMTRSQNKYVGRIIYTKLFQAILPDTLCFENEFHLDPKEHSSYLFMTPQEMMARHKNNRGARLHRGTSFALEILAQQGNPSYLLNRTR